MKDPYPQGLAEALRDHASDQIHSDAATLIEQQENLIQKLRERLVMVMRYAAPEVFTKEYRNVRGTDIHWDLIGIANPEHNPEANIIELNEDGTIKGSILVTAQYNPEPDS